MTSRLERLRAEARAHVAAIRLPQLAPVAEMPAAALKRFLSGDPPASGVMPAKLLRQAYSPRQVDAADALERSHALRTLVSCLPAGEQEAGAGEMLVRLRTHYSAIGTEPGWLRRLLDHGPFL